MALYSYFEKDQYDMALPNKVFHSILYSMVISNFWAFIVELSWPIIYGMHVFTHLSIIQILTAKDK